MKRILIGNVLEKIKEIDDKSVDCIVTSPPYYAMRNYGTRLQVWDGTKECDHDWDEIKTRRMNLSGGKTAKQLTNKGSYAVDYNDRYTVSYQCKRCGAWKGELGQEPTADLYIKHMADIFTECKRVLKDEGALWINIADTYIDSGLSRKGLYCIPDRLKIELADNGWICRMENIWHVTNKMPTSVRDRFNTDHEKMFMFVKQQKYFFKQQYVEGKDGKPRAMRTVWDIPNGASFGSNTASFPKALVEIPIKATTPVNGVVLDIFAGSGIVLDVAEELGFDSIGIDLKEDFIKECYNKTCSVKK